jgi:hypothetical protein
MNIQTIIRNILAFILGLIAGSFVNMGIIMISGNIIPPPDGADLTTEEGLKAAMKMMEAKHFIMPFLAHALGTFAGASLCSAIAVSLRFYMVMLIASLFFVGGIYMVMLLPSPLWFNLTDLILAYFPMAFLGYYLLKKKQIQ